jgi:ubiquinone/menaquinone biosynthesis C-methylase UbiE
MAPSASKSETAPERDFVPALRLRALTRFYDPIVALSTRERRFKRLLLEQLSPQPGQRILDLGCGTGTLALLIKEREPGAEIHALDADPEILARARSKAEKYGGHEVSFVQGLSNELPYEDESFDRVVTSLFFHHLTREVKLGTAAEIVRVLRPGGELHFADWGRPSDPFMAVLSLGIRALDGFEPTRDNFRGRLPAVLEEGGLADARQTNQLRTAFGTMGLYRARKSGDAA